ncbi:MAG: hypothetical protein ACYDAY_08405 [Candidatus Dormibacteria bacterium]
MGDMPFAEPEPGSARVSDRGRLKVFLGATPGAGKTFALLREGHDLLAAGRDVVVAVAETYDRPRTVELLEGLEVLARCETNYLGASFREMNLAAVLERRPEVALVDELAHANPPGLGHAHRWQDIEELLLAGIDVVTTVNVQHVESVKDLVESVTGVIVRETVPDRILDAADAMVFIDIAPEALRKRMRHGNVFPKAGVDRALDSYFRPASLAVMRQIGLRWTADSMARSHRVLLSPEDVMVAVAVGPSSELLMRRGARLARRHGGSCLVVSVLDRGVTLEEVERCRSLAERLGAGFVVLRSDDVAGAVIAAARHAGSEHVVMGEARRLGVTKWGKDVVERVIDGLPEADVHVIARFEQ